MTWRATSALYASSVRPVGVAEGIGIGDGGDAISARAVLVGAGEGDLQAGSRTSSVSRRSRNKLPRFEIFMMDAGQSQVAPVLA